MGIRASSAHPWALNTGMASEHHDPYAGVPMVNHGCRTTYVVLLRGINVGGAHRLAMADLHAVCAAAGCTDVRTYIQSGNVVLSSSQPAANLTVELERRISTHAGFSVPAVVRTSVEWASVMRRRSNRSTSVHSDALPSDRRRTCGYRQARPARHRVSNFVGGDRLSLLRPTKFGSGNGARLLDSFEETEAAALASEPESAAVDCRKEDLLVGRAAAVGGVGEHVVDRQGATNSDVGCPSLVVGSRRYLAVAAIDEQQPEWGAPVLRHDRRPADDGDHARLQPRVVHSPAKHRQRVHPTDALID